MVEMPSVIWSEERVDEILALANELDVGFGTALKLYRAGSKTPDQVAALSIDKLIDITDLSRAAAERLVYKIKYIRKEEASFEAGPVEERPVKAKATERPAPTASSDVPSKFEIPDPKGEPIELEAGSKVQYGKYYHINESMIKVWVMNGPVWMTLVIILTCSPLVIWLMPVLGLLFGFMVVLVLLLSMWWAGLAYENYTFAFTRDLVIVRSGVLWKQEIHIPYGRIQNINTHQDIVDRMFGVWHLSISATGAVSMIHGVPDHETVKAFILENVEAVKAKRAPKVDGSQGYREVYVALKSISRNLKGHSSRAIVSHT